MSDPTAGRTDSLHAPPLPGQHAFIDWRQFRALLRVYFRLNSRGQMRQTMGHAGKGMNIFGVLAFYSLFGAFFALGLLTGKSDVFAFSLLMQGTTFVLVGMAVIVESSQILFNPLEEDVLGHRPVASRTLIAAKMVNLMVVSSSVAVGFNLVPMFCTLALHDARPWSPLAHLVALLQTDLFCVSGVVFVYGLMARLVGRERFQLLVTWSQIIMTVVFVGGFQIVPRLMGQIQLTGFEDRIWYLIVFPPAWFSALESVLATLNGSRVVYLMALAGLMAPPVLAWAAVMRLASRQHQISSGLVERTAVARPRRVSVRATRVNSLLRLWLSDPVERASFCLAARYMRHDRFTMQQLYPQFAFIFIYPLVMLFSAPKFGGLFFLGFGLWSIAMLPPMALEILRRSENCAAGELFAIAPLSGPSKLFHGARKAVLFYLVLPSSLLMLTIFAFVTHEFVNDLLICLPLLLMIPAISLTPGISELWLPLSLPPRQGGQQTRQAMVFGTMLVSGLTVSLSYVLAQLGLQWLLIVTEIPILLILHWALQARINRNRNIRIHEGQTAGAAQS